MKKKQKKEARVPIDLVLDLTSSEYINFDKANQKVEDKLKELHWYDRKVYNLIQDEYSITELSKRNKYKLPQFVQHI